VTARCLSTSHVVWDGSALSLAKPCGCALRLLLSEQQAEQVEGWWPSLEDCNRTVSEGRCEQHGAEAS
jgi:hypothetical protein